MIWLIISLICFVWVIVWTVIHASLFKQAVIYKCRVKGAPLWTLFVPIIICAITLALFIKTVT
jgi:hypothetical protein